jgi:hypothetical protein
METINTIELKDEQTYPSEEVLRDVLGNSYSAYEELLQIFAQHELDCQWRYYKDGKAWLCKVQRKTKTIVWMSAWKGYMQASIYFPERMIAQVIALKLSSATVSKIKSTKSVGKSKPCIFEIRNAEILKDFSTVMQFKLLTK